MEKLKPSPLLEPSELNESELLSMMSFFWRPLSNKTCIPMRYAHWLKSSRFLPDEDIFLWSLNASSLVCGFYFVDRPWFIFNLELLGNFLALFRLFGCWVVARVVYCIALGCISWFTPSSLPSLENKSAWELPLLIPFLPFFLLSASFLSPSFLP